MRRGKEASPIEDSGDMIEFLVLLEWQTSSKRENDEKREAEQLTPKIAMLLTALALSGDVKVEYACPR